MAKSLSYITFNNYSLGLTILTFAVVTLINSGCVDDVIEGASTTPQQFAATKATSSFTTVNTCTSTTPSGTIFNVKIDLAGMEQVGFASGRYKFSTQANFTELSSYTYVQTGGSSTPTTGFRTPVKSGSSNANYITVTHCVRFGTSTTITYEYDLISNDGNVSSISVVITRPTNAN